MLLRSVHGSEVKKPCPGELSGPRAKSLMALAFRARLAKRAWLPSLGSPEGIWRNAELSGLPMRRPGLPSHWLIWVLAVTLPVAGQLLLASHVSHHRELACRGPLSLAQEPMSQYSETILNCCGNHQFPLSWLLLCLELCLSLTCFHRSYLSSSGFSPSRDDTYL